MVDKAVRVDQLVTAVAAGPVEPERPAQSDLMPLCQGVTGPLEAAELRAASAVPVALAGHCAAMAETAVSAESVGLAEREDQVAMGTQLLHRGVLA
jgi:hypothetical protein